MGYLSVNMRDRKVVFGATATTTVVDIRSWRNMLRPWCGEPRRVASLDVNWRKSPGVEEQVDSMRTTCSHPLLAGMRARPKNPQAMNLLRPEPLEGVADHRKHCGGRTIYVQGRCTTRVGIERRGGELISWPEQLITASTSPPKGSAGMVHTTAHTSCGQSPRTALSRLKGARPGDRAAVHMRRGYGHVSVFGSEQNRNERRPPQRKSRSWGFRGVRRDPMVWTMRSLPKVSAIAPRSRQDDPNEHLETLQDYCGRTVPPVLTLMSSEHRCLVRKTEPGGRQS